MKILVLTTDSYGGHGGIALYNRDMIDALADIPQISEIAVLSRNMTNPPEEMPAKVRFVYQSLRGKLAYLVSSLAEMAVKYDLIVCGHINLLPLAVALNLRQNTRLVLTIYGIDVWTKPGYLRQTLLKQVHNIWSITALTRDRMNVWAKLPATRYTILPNAIHLDRYGLNPPRQEIVDRYHLSGCRVIMTLARLPGFDRYKGVDEMLEVMPALLEREPSLRYVVAGDGSDRARLQAKSSSLGIDKYVTFTGMVAEHEKADLLRIADVFVMPGRGEGFGFVFLEALACGIPVVGSLMDGSREALLEGKLGELVDPTSAESIIDGVFKALAKPKTLMPDLDYYAWPAYKKRIASAVENLTI